MQRCTVGDLPIGCLVGALVLLRLAEDEPNTPARVVASADLAPKKVGIGRVAEGSLEERPEIAVSLGLPKSVPVTAPMANCCEESFPGLFGE